MRQTDRAPCRASKIAAKKSRSNSGNAPLGKASPTKARASAQKFQAEFDVLDKRLAQHPYLMGDNLSVLDIAWFIYAQRLSLAGYPLARLHPGVGAWVEKLRSRQEFSKEIAMAPEAAARLEATHRTQAQIGKTLEIIAGFNSAQRRYAAKLENGQKKSREELK
jgi:hypothetical protein